MVFIRSASSFSYSALFYPSVWLLQRSALPRMGLGRIQPLRFHPWFSQLSLLRPASVISPVYSAKTIPAWARLLPSAGEAYAAKTIMQISRGHQSTNEHLPSQYYLLITSLGKYRTSGERANASSTSADVTSCD